MTQANAHHGFFTARLAGRRAREFDVLLACISHRDADGTALRAALGRVTDWDLLRDLTRAHRLEPQLYRRLSDGCRDIVPPPFIEDLARIHSERAKRNLRMAAYLLRVVEAFQVEGIRVAPFKGPVLAEYLYGDVARPTCLT